MRSSFFRVSFSSRISFYSIIWQTTKPEQTNRIILILHKSQPASAAPSTAPHHALAKTQHFSRKCISYSLSAPRSTQSVLPYFLPGASNYFLLSKISLLLVYHPVNLRLQSPHINRIYSSIDYFSHHLDKFDYLVSSYVFKTSILFPT